MQFTIQASDEATNARAGEIHTQRGVIQTPIFMPVGTAGSVKAIHQRELYHDIQAQIILGNTYHLYLRPGMEIMEKAGGLHGFMKWDKPILTDSGGYQVFSLGDNRKIKEEGVWFQSHIDGSKHLFSPERVMEIEQTIGADFVMAFDECPPGLADYAYVKKSMHLTHRWLDRCIEHRKTLTPKYGFEQTLVPIVQGGIFKELREESARYIAEKNCEANAIGGLSVGEPAPAMYEMLEVTNAILPKEKPRYLMGVGTPENILEGIARGVDMFDCVMPTRNARNGMLFTTQGILNIRNEKWKMDFSPIDETLGGYASSYYSKAYLRHLIISKEILGAQIASLHNLTFYLWLVREARTQILNGHFSTWKNSILPILSQRL